MAANSNRSNRARDIESPISGKSDGGKSKETGCCTNEKEKEGGCCGGSKPAPAKAP